MFIKIPRTSHFKLIRSVLIQFDVDPKLTSEKSHNQTLPLRNLA